MVEATLKNGHSQSASTEGVSDGELLRRFVAWRDEAAFRGLVQRLGPMVLAVCQRVLHDRHEAEDAFQATFLVLARKAGTLSRPELLGNWLYGVAYRIAYKVKSRAARRRFTEAQAARPPGPEPSVQAAWREVQAVVDDELNGLPEKYRVPLVLVYLEGKTHEEAAALLGCPAGSMSWRLTRGRELLRRRLSGRGLVLSIALLLLVLTPAAAAPVALVKATVKWVMLDALGILGPQTLPGSVAVMMQIGLASRVAAKGGLWSLLLAILVMLALGAGVMAYQSWGGGPSSDSGRPDLVGTSAGSGCGSGEESGARSQESGVRNR
jgi:RNA polymerase sigma factor (sigma-70 family)